MPSTPINNAPNYLSMPDFKALSDAYGGLAKACRFAVRIIPQGTYVQQIAGYFPNELVYLCEAAEYPGRGFNNIDVRYYGPNLKLPYQTLYEDMTLTFLCRNGSRERTFFDDWQTLINPVDTFDFTYRDEYRSQIEIYQFDENNEAQYYFVLHNAYPILVNPQQLTWADDQFLRLGVTFTYSWWTRPGLDPESKNRNLSTVWRSSEWRDNDPFNV